MGTDGKCRNEGKLISDGKYLRDFTFTYDPVGHLPPWLDMLSYSPGQFPSSSFSRIETDEMDVCRILSQRRRFLKFFWESRLL